MKSIAVSCVAAAALTLSLVSPTVVALSSHDTQLAAAAAHKRRFHRAARQETQEESVIDVDLETPEELVVRTASSPVGQHGDAKTTAAPATSSNRLMKRDYNGRATFFEPGLGACGGYSSAGDFVRPPHAPWRVVD
jgi:hypothetical protein